jgi:dTDP-4-dehydrorhamnose reductase
MTAVRRVLVLGATGMLGHVVLSLLAQDGAFDVTGTVRSLSTAKLLSPDLQSRLIPGIDVENVDLLASAFAYARPEIVINCVGLVKQLSTADDPLAALPLNAMLPHRLTRLCAIAGARLIHISTDCVFSGAKGMYLETDPSDAKDLYGRSKYLGEVDAPHAVTLRTSIVGPELASAHGLLEWFLSQRER